jgi:hypothetical protein
MFGTGLAGATGLPGFGATTAPLLGGPPFDLAGWQLPANATILFLLSFTGHDDGVAPWMGGFLHATPDIVVALPTTAAGTFALGIPPLPDAPILHGLPLFSQLVTADASAPQGYGLSAGLRLVLDR